MSGGCHFGKKGIEDDEDRLPDVIRHFGRQEKIFFAHFRDMRGTSERFAEAFDDDGKTDMAACIRA